MVAPETCRIIIKTIDKLENLKVQDDGKLKLHSSILSFENNISSYLN